MLNTSTPLFVHYQSETVGRLEQSPDEQLRFQYTESWRVNNHAFPISLSLPLNGDFSDKAAHHFFVNLLPEESVRQRICQALKISPGNDFELLRAIGGDCAGALAITEAEQGLDYDDQYEPIDEKQLANWSAGTPDAFSAITGQNQVRLSLAGAQDKLPVHIHDNQFLIPHGNSPSTYLLKFASPFYSHLPENETFVTLIGSELGLPVVDIGLHTTSRKRIAVIKRYDRLATEQGRYQRIHQEDFCQALGINPRNKYEKEGGPSISACAKIVRDHCSLPIVELKKLVNWVLFNLLIGNSDAHGKNLSLLYLPNGQRTLAPFYDLVCTRNYPRIDRHLAMKIGDRSDPDLVGKVQLKQMASELGVGELAAKTMIQNMPIGIKNASQLFHR
ncbi:MAG: type II toxin-antitoxin system HipA family toxin [Pirellulaceae bacterium]